LVIFNMKKLIRKLENSNHGIMVYTQFGYDKFLFYENNSDTAY